MYGSNRWYFDLCLSIDVLANTQGGWLYFFHTKVEVLLSISQQMISFKRTKPVTVTSG